MRKPFITFGALLLTALAGAAAPAAAQRIDPDRVIDLHVNAEADNRSFDGSVIEGGRFRMTFAGHGTYEIAPILVDAATNTFRLTIYSGPEGAATGALREVEKVNARQGIAVAIRSMPAVSVIVDGTRRRSTTSQAPAQSTYRLASLGTSGLARPTTFDGECCVTCGNITVCGCAVSGMSCGSCCSDGCCKPKQPVEEEVKPVALRLQPRSFTQLAGTCGKQVKDEERILTPRLNRTAVASR
jgi:hypothetical protein